MRFMRLIISLIICVMLLSSCKSVKLIPEREERTEGSFVLSVSDESNKQRLACKHTDFSGFYNSVQNPKDFTLNGDVIGGIVPHHMAAATLVSGFFKAVAESNIEYDTVVIVAPNHEGETGNIVVSFLDWQAWDTVYCDRNIVENVYNKIPDEYTAIESDDRMEQEHSVSVLIPYINHYLPEAKVAAFLLNRRLTLENIYNFARILSDEINTSGKKVLFISSIDFSHFLPVSAAIENDRITEAAILDRDYGKIHSLSNEYVDSPQSLNTFLMYMENNGADNIEILYNTNASEFIGDAINQTTSYFIITAYN